MMTTHSHTETDIQIKGKLYSTSGIFTVTAAVQYENSVAGTFLLPPNMVTYNFDPTVIPWSLSDGVWKLPGNDNYNLTLGTLSRFVRATPFTIQVTYKDVSNVEYRQCIDMIVTGARYVGGGVGLAVNGWAVLVVAVVALLV